MHVVGGRHMYTVKLVGVVAPQSCCVIWSVQTILVLLMMKNNYPLFLISVFLFRCNTSKWPLKRLIAMWDPSGQEFNLLHPSGRRVYLIYFNAFWFSPSTFCLRLAYADLIPILMFMHLADYRLLKIITI